MATARIGIVALAAAFTLSCSSRDDDSIVVGALRFPSSAPLFLAEEEGFYEREGLDVEFRFFQAAQPVALATTTGDVDFGVTGLTAGFYNLAAGGRLKVIAGQSRVVPGHRFIAYCTTPGGMESLEELEGARVGITQQGSTFHYMVGLLADSRGIELDSVRLVPLESVPNMVAALRGEQVDAVLLPAHLALALEAESTARILGWVGDETPWPLGALFTSSENLEARPETVAAFLRAYRSAVELYVDVLLDGAAGGDPAGDARAIELATVLQEYIPSSVDDIRRGTPFIPRDAVLEAADLAPQIAWFQERGLVDADLDPASFVPEGACC